MPGPTSLTSPARPGRRRAIGACVVGALLAAGLAAASPAQGWRFDGSGRWPDADPPVSWGEGRNVAWSTRLPSWSNASPVLVGELVCAESEPVTLICLDAATGRIRWSADNPIVDAVEPQRRAEIAASVARKDALEQTLAGLRTSYGAALKQARASGDPKLAAAATALGKESDRLKAELAQGPDYRTPPNQGMIGWSSPTPATDGTAIYASFANGVVAAYEKDGRRRWAHWLGPMLQPMNGWDEGHAASPVVVGGVVVVPFRRLTGIDARTGRILWQGEEWRHYGGATPLVVSGVPTVVTPDGRIVRVADGRVLADGLADMLYFSPIVDGDRVYLLEARSEQALRAAGGVELKAWRVTAITGDVARTESLWTTKVPVHDAIYCGPVLADGWLQLTTRQADVFTIAAATGAVSGPVPLTPIQPTLVYASPVAAAGRVYVTDEGGRTVVLKNGAPPEVLGVSTLWPMRASAALAGRRMYLRTKDHLVALEAR